MATTYATVTPENYNTIERGTPIELRTVKDEAITGTFVSVNSKGINIKDDRGGVVSRSLRTVAQVAIIHTNPDTPADLFTDGDEYTTAELAAAFDMTARALRIELRKMGVGVGKGHTYKFSADEARKVFGTLNAK